MDSNIKKTENFFQQTSAPRLNLELPKETEPVTDVIKSGSRLNDYDSNILNDKSNWQIDNEALKLEYKIKDKQNALSEISRQMRKAEEYDNRQELFSLRIKRQRIETELAELNREQAKTGLGARLSKKAVNDWGLKPVKKIQEFISRNILAKISKKFNSIMDLGDSLDKLSSINKSVDELMTMKVPHGETMQNYEKLTAYLYQANKIRSQITKNMGRIK